MRCGRLNWQKVLSVSVADKDLDNFGHKIEF